MIIKNRKQQPYLPHQRFVVFVEDCLQFEPQSPSFLGVADDLKYDCIVETAQNACYDGYN